MPTANARRHFTSSIHASARPVPPSPNRLLAELAYILLLTTQEQKGKIMRFMNFLSRSAPSFSDLQERNETPVQTLSEQEPVRPDLPPSASELQSPESVDKALEMLKTIQEILHDEEDGVLAVPCRALLQNLPENLRGEKWQPYSFPDVALELPRDVTLKQLRKGRVSFPLNDYLPVLPEGWVQAQPEAMVDFDLPTVVQAIPLEWLHPATIPSKQVEAVRHIPDYFKPAVGAAELAAAAAPALEATAPITPAPTLPDVAAEQPLAMPTVEPPAAEFAAAAAPALEATVPITPAPTLPDVAAEQPLAMPTVEPPATAPRPLGPGEWSGVEPALDIGVLSVDINRATEADLLCLPNIGPLRAQAILRYRQDHGPFASIFDLADVPGIGRRLFRQITGLSFRRTNRHEVLNGLLGLPLGSHPTLSHLMVHIRDVLAAAGCVLSNTEGLALAASGLPDERTTRYAALVPQLFRRARRYLAALDPTPPGCLVIPTAEAPLLCYQVSNCFLIITLPAGSPLDPALKPAGAIAREIHWLLGCRAVMHACG